MTMPPLDSASLLMCPHGGTLRATPAAPTVRTAGRVVLSGSAQWVVAGCAAPIPCLSARSTASSARVAISGFPALTAVPPMCVAADGASTGPATLVPSPSRITVA